MRREYMSITSPKAGQVSYHDLAFTLYAAPRPKLQQNLGTKPLRKHSNNMQWSTAEQAPVHKQ
eukprot:scaffold74509_cov18-Tisochrysis_lutea.AAC.2